MQASKLFIRVVPADRNRGYMLLAGYEANVTQRTALSYSTLGAPSRASLNAAVERIRIANSAAEVQDVTAPNIAKQLAKLFGEYDPGQPKGQAEATFSSLGIGQYLAS